MLEDDVVIVDVVAWLLRKLGEHSIKHLASLGYLLAVSSHLEITADAVDDGRLCGGKCSIHSC